MTTAPDHHEPLDDEERDLAARLGRIGPLDGPPPALDAKILAAAHAAAIARTPGRRRLAWIGVPPALVTGTGVAAAAVLALGLVWQLRPQPGIVMSRGEADAGEEVILIAEPAGAARAPTMNPPPVPEEHAAADAAVARPQPAATPARSQASRESAKVVDLPQSKAEAAAAGESAALAAQAASVDKEKREAERALHDAASEPGFVAEPPAAAAPVAAHKHATYTTAARARAEQRQRAAANVASAPAAPASAPPEYDAAAASAAASAEAQTTLDRIEVTGSRIARDSYTDWSQVPVSDDTHLAAAAWLERIRARRDDDDTDNARASLRLFQREYPRVRLPDDLRELLADAER